MKKLIASLFVFLTGAFLCYAPPVSTSHAVLATQDGTVLVPTNLELRIVASFDHASEVNEAHGLILDDIAHKSEIQGASDLKLNLDLSNLTDIPYSMVVDAQDNEFDGEYLYNTEQNKWWKSTTHYIWKDGVIWKLTDGTILYTAADNGLSTPPTSFTRTLDYPLTITVSGAGTIAANGIYTYDGFENEKPSWIRGTRKIHVPVGFDMWFIQIGTSAYEYGHSVLSYFPEKTGWIKGKSISPPPTLEYVLEHTATAIGSSKENMARIAGIVHTNNATYTGAVAKATAAYSWGNHAGLYPTISSWNMSNSAFSAQLLELSLYTNRADVAYSWGNHASAGYLTSFTELDPAWHSGTQAVWSAISNSIQGATISTGAVYSITTNENKIMSITVDTSAKERTVTMRWPNNQNASASTYYPINAGWLYGLEYPTSGTVYSGFQGERGATNLIANGWFFQNDVGQNFGVHLRFGFVSVTPNGQFSSYNLYTNIQRDAFGETNVFSFNVPISSTIYTNHNIQFVVFAYSNFANPTIRFPTNIPTSGGAFLFTGGTWQIAPGY